MRLLFSLVIIGICDQKFAGVSLTACQDRRQMFGAIAEQLHYEANLQNKPCWAVRHT